MDAVDIEKMAYDEITALLKTEYSDVITNKMPEKPMKCEPYVIEINKEKAKAVKTVLQDKVDNGGNR